MGAVRIALNPNGPRKIRRSPGAQADLLRRAQAMAAAAGEGIEADSGMGKNRARAIVYTATTAGVVAESEAHVIEASIDAGR